jgi:uncharacterized protein (TIGR03083 family)
MTTIDWVGEYQATRGRICDLVADLHETEARAPVPPCPAWTVHDVLAHVTGLASALGNRQLPSGDQQTWLDGLVEQRRGRSVGELVDEWQAAGAAIDAFLAGMGAGGSQLVYDAVSHEHDIRLALGRPGARDSSGVHACAEAMSRLLAADLAKAGLPAVRVTSDGRTWDVGDGEPELAIELEPFELIRVFGSRRSEAQLRALPWRGDLDRYLPGLAHHPLPTKDIVE